MFKVALRYCGGCNPRYDRAALVSRLRLTFPKLKLEAYAGPSEQYQAVLVICGCTACCAGQRDLPKTLPRFVLSNSNEYEQAAAFLSGLILNKEIDNNGLANLLSGKDDFS